MIIIFLIRANTLGQYWHRGLTVSFVGPTLIKVDSKRVSSSVTDKKFVISFFGSNQFSVGMFAKTQSCGETAAPAILTDIWKVNLNPSIHLDLLALLDFEGQSTLKLKAS